MIFKYNDGGRQEAGFRGVGGDCVARSIAIASGRPYKEVYDALAQGNKTQIVSAADKRRIKRRAFGKATASHGINVGRKWFKDYMASLGFVWVPTMGIGQVARTHLTEKELPKGRLVVQVSKHYLAVIDHEIHDTHDSQREVHWSEPYRGQELKYNQRLNEANNLVCWTSERLVYGYWQLFLVKV